MIRASEIGLGVNVIDAYQNSIRCIAKCNSSRLGGSNRLLEGIIDGGVYWGGTGAYDLLGPSSFFPISEPRSLTPKIRSSLARIWVLGMAFPDS